MALQKEYFELTAKYIKNYGEKTILLMQVGAFFEVYGIRNKQTNQLTGSQIMDFGRICELAIVDKNTCVSNSETGVGSNMVMAGFKDIMIEKYIKKLQDDGFTTVVYTQDENMKNTTRSLFAIFSPGTYFSNDTTKLTNNTTCVWIEKICNTRFMKGTYVVIGIANIDIYTGKTAIFQYKENYIHNPTTYDELERFISIYQPSEVIFLSNLPKREVADIIQFANIQAKSIHTIDLSLDTNVEKEKEKEKEKDKSAFYEKAKKCEKQVFQKEILSGFYKKPLCFDKFFESEIATQAFCFLLDFIYQHNHHLVYKVDEPVFENQSQRMVLANHSLKQLNIIDDQQYQGPYSSVLKLLNKCQTAMGKRKFTHQLLGPTTNVEFLEREYEIIGYFLDGGVNAKIYDDAYNKLTEINDLVKWERQVFLKKITPSAFYKLYQNICAVSTMYCDIYHKNITENNVFHKYLSLNIPEVSKVKDFCKEITDFIESHLVLEQTKEVDTLTLFETNFIQKGIDAELDTKAETLLESLDKLASIQIFLNSLIDNGEKGKGKGKGKMTEYVKIHETEKNNFSLITTGRRCKFIEQGLKELAFTIKELEYKSSYDGIIKTFEFKCSAQDFTFPKQSAANCFIVSAGIDILCKNISFLKTSMRELISVAYRKFLDMFEEYNDRLEVIIQFISFFDITYTKSVLAKKYHYCRPKLAEADKSFVNCTGLRHILVEQLNTDELYVTNDLILGSGAVDGMLLYGTNAVGKTCFIKALGICIIMAQSGMYVPCTEFVFKPYHYLFTRILGNDNIFKGLSTFAVEMSELRTILRLADANSLVLGDELCSGTENVSAISIFMAGIIRLYEKGSSFIFATHLHEIVNYEEIRVLSRLVLRHMSVVYDKERGQLIYDRRLQDGAGSSLYGLEVCKSLNLPEEFLESAFKIRTKYYPDTEGMLSLTQSRYNAKKIVGGLCEKCGINRSVEIHHILHQADAGEDGYIVDRENGYTVHKNHPANLMALCEKCHQGQHKN